MTPTDFRIARLRLGLSPAQLVERLRALGWHDLTVAAVHSWAARRGAQTRPVPGHVVAILALLTADARCLKDCSDEQLHTEITQRRTERDAAHWARAIANARYLCPDCGAPDSWHMGDCPSDTSP